MYPSILLVGCGKMGSALLSGWLKHNITPGQVTVVEPYGEQAKKLGVKVVDSIDVIDKQYRPDVVIFAVKPQNMGEILPAYLLFFSPQTLCISIAAGKTIEFFEKILGNDKAVIRTMPNLPAVVGMGATVACANKSVTAQHKALCDQLLGSVGELLWLEDESLLDAVTAISGSGPAYVFHFIEALTAAGERLGLPKNIAESLAYATLKGSVALLQQSSQSPAELRHQVTSPGGTTAAALQVLMGEQGLQSLLERAATAACERSKQLS